MDKDGALYAPFPHCKEEKLFSFQKCDILIVSKKSDAPKKHRFS